MLFEDSAICGGPRTYPLSILIDDHISIFDIWFSETRFHYVALAGLELTI